MSDGRYRIRCAVLQAEVSAKEILELIWRKKIRGCRQTRVLAECDARLKLAATFDEVKGAKQSRKLYLASE